MRYTNSYVRHRLPYFSHSFGMSSCLVPFLFFSFRRVACINYPNLDVVVPCHFGCIRLNFKFFVLLMSSDHLDGGLHSTIFVVHLSFLTLSAACELELACSVPIHRCNSFNCLCNTSFSSNYLI